MGAEVIITIIAIAAGAIYWHFKEIKHLKDEIHKLQLTMKDLEKKDEIQQITIDSMKGGFEFMQNMVQGVLAKGGRK
jgi:D-mannonate dehydratase